MSVYKSSLLLLCLTSIRSTKIDNSTETESNNPIYSASTNSKAIVVDCATNDRLYNNKTTVSEDFLELQMNLNKTCGKVKTREDAFISALQEKEKQIKTKDEKIRDLEDELATTKEKLFYEKEVRHTLQRKLERQNRDGGKNTPKRLISAAESLKLFAASYRNPGQHHTKNTTQ